MIFSNNPTRSKYVVTPQMFGAKADGVTDDTIAIQACIDHLDANQDTQTGGEIYFQRGKYMITTDIIIRTTHSSALSSITIRGDGIHNTQIYAKTGFSGTNMILASEPAYCVFKDIHLYGNNLATNGLNIVGGSHITLDNVFAQSCQTGYGFLFGPTSFMTTVRGCRAKSNAIGFGFIGYHTSTTMIGCYGLSNGTSNYDLYGMTYSSLIGCGSDISSYGYRISNSAALSLISCGSEQTQHEAFRIFATEADDSYSIIKGVRVTLTECFSDGADLLDGGHGSIKTSQTGTTGGIYAKVNQFYEYRVTGTTSVSSDGDYLDQYISLRDGKFVNPINTSMIISRSSDYM